MPYLYGFRVSQTPNLKVGREDKANRLASELPHTRESREVIQPLIQQKLSDFEIDENIKVILLGDGKEIW